MQRIVLLVWLAAVAASASCASAQARTAADRPTLEVPAPPARTIEPTARPEPATPEPVPDLPPPAPPNPKPKPAANREPARTDPKPEVPAAEVPQPPVAPVTPPPQLRTSSVDGAEAERQVRTILDRASKALKLVDHKGLSNARRKEYDNAVLMMAQSEENLKTANFEIARNLANKADQIAKELQSR
jgi:colicin import membrane protein